MLKPIAIAACLMGAAGLTACTTTDGYTGREVRNNTGTGILAGAAAGAALGYLTNTSKSEQGRKNALIGAGIGALAGGVAGNYMDRQQADLRRELADTNVGITRQGDNIVLSMPSDVTFAVDRSDIQPQFQSTLADLSRILNNYPQTIIDVAGHADSSGPDDYNMALSQRRAASVADAMIANGVVRDRLYVVGYGETRPIASNDTAAGKAQNRRVEVTLRPLT